MRRTDRPAGAPDSAADGGPSTTFRARAREKETCICTRRRTSRDLEPLASGLSPAVQPGHPLQSRELPDYEWLREEFGEGSTRANIEKSSRPRASPQSWLPPPRSLSRSPVSQEPERERLITGAVQAAAGSSRTCSHWTSSQNSPRRYWTDRKGPRQQARTTVRLSVKILPPPRHDDSDKRPATTKAQDTKQQEQGQKEKTIENR